MSHDALWAGEFGDRYTERNETRNLATRRTGFWTRLQGDYPFQSILEVGCNAGANLQAIARSGSAERICGVDINVRALLLLRGSWEDDPLRLETREASATNLPFADGAFELAFTCGTLIHLSDDDLGPAIRELFRVSRRYLLVMEYLANERVTVPYRGQADALIKRPYGDIVLSLVPVTQILSGHLGDEDGFDDVTFWLFEKRDGRKSK